MTVSRRPRPGEPQSPASERDIEAIIHRGGEIAGQRRGHPPGAPGALGKPRKLVLRLPEALLERVDDAVRARPLPTTRHAWLLEAVHEKLTRKDD